MSLSLCNAQGKHSSVPRQRELLAYRLSYASAATVLVVTFMRKWTPVCSGHAPRLHVEHQRVEKLAPTQPRHRRRRLLSRESHLHISAKLSSGVSTANVVVPRGIAGARVTFIDSGDSATSSTGTSATALP
ncbi:hypothetical protein CGC20_35920 [Leishmania donovani]|uniref:Uncharacterized protein n=1 Tax=Leishmania donovani TaxID=5661 RepID=A0A504XUV0_LEIDO|nr:hypothetical protein CGC20_35920 [Leishmania donovani]